MLPYTKESKRLQGEPGHICPNPLVSIFYGYNFHNPVFLFGFQLLLYSHSVARRSNLIEYLFTSYHTCQAYTVLGAVRDINGMNMKLGYFSPMF